jgi:hypothetical protein
VGSPTGEEATGQERRPLRVCIDLNVFVAALLATERGHLIGEISYLKPGRYWRRRTTTSR